MDTKLNRDELFLIAMDLNISSLINLCKSSKKINEKICNNNGFWRNKLYKDYPNALMIPNNIITDYKTLYKTVATSKWSYYHVYSLKAEESKPAVLLNFISKKYLPLEDRNTYWKDILSPEDIKRLSSHEFFIRGSYPSGTKIWLYFIGRHSYIGRANTREKAIEEFMDFIRKQGQPSAIIRKIDLQTFKDTLNDKGEVEIVGDRTGYKYNFIVREFTLP